MTDRIFVSVDAARLAELSSKLTLTARDQADLFGIAERLERLDERLRNIDSATPVTFGKTYADGVRDERARIFGRSNLPVQSVELREDDADFIATAVALGRVKRVVKKKPVPPPKKPVVPKHPSVAGIKIDLSTLRIKV